MFGKRALGFVVKVVFEVDVGACSERRAVFLDAATRMNAQVARWKYFFGEDEIKFNSLHVDTF